jgi:hypothetical protein
MKTLGSVLIIVLVLALAIIMLGAIKTKNSPKNLPKLPNTLG